ncbi:hypothetical protein K504DRAFT_394125 [Pleomassaria siparia CBS 279.74]|uniref:MYND-type domain-containing protein n=1 Tax=Pleomassaria siparia CBS 279.74 TaxID=1314801 RepID=A0A6G1JQZ8_9PLEO|nr:hypothetical protein K504DRAFT_394125 [Pleomassaria siparia CBS 279.74]
MEPLDLVDIAVLLTYERTSTDARFRNAKLKDFSYSKPTGSIVIDMEKHPEETDTTPDTASNILPLDPCPKLAALSSKEQETIFHQVRGHDGRYTSTALLQHFFDQYPPDTPLHVRHLKKSDSYTTVIKQRVICEIKLNKPTYNILTRVTPGEETYASGFEPTQLHSHIMIAPTSAAGRDFSKTFLDLASMRYGDVGRGFKGKALFVLDTAEEYDQRLPRMCRGPPDYNMKTSARIGPMPTDAWLKEVAARVKERWENREREKWCGHCGAPAPKSRCSRCKQVWFCGEEHQKATWPFHKVYCISESGT